MRKLWTSFAVALFGFSCLACSVAQVGCARGCEPVKAYVSTLEELARDAEVTLYQAQKVISKIPDSEERAKALKVLEDAGKALGAVRQTLNTAILACTSPSPSALFEVFNDAWGVLRLFLIPLIADNGVGAAVKDPACYAFRRR